MPLKATIYRSTRDIIIVGLRHVLTLGHDASPGRPVGNWTAVAVSHLNWAQQNPGVRPHGAFQEQVVFAIAKEDAIDLDLNDLEPGEYLEAEVHLTIKRRTES